jgi:hypothetical protein
MVLAGLHRFSLFLSVVWPESGHVGAALCLASLVSYAPPCGPRCKGTGAEITGLDRARIGAKMAGWPVIAGQMGR